MTTVQSVVYRFADVEVDDWEFSVIRGGEVLAVEPKAFQVLIYLLRNPRRLIAKEELINAVWGDAAVTENSLTRSILKLRRLLGDDVREPRYIETVAKVGYRWVCKVEVAEELQGLRRHRSRRLCHSAKARRPGAQACMGLGVAGNRPWGGLAAQSGTPLALAAAAHQRICADHERRPRENSCRYGRKQAFLLWMPAIFHCPGCHNKQLPAGPGCGAGSPVSVGNI